MEYNVWITSSSIKWKGWIEQNRPGVNDNYWDKESLHRAVHPSDGNLDIFLTASVQESSRNSNEGAPSSRTYSRRHGFRHWILVKKRGKPNTTWTHIHLYPCRDEQVHAASSLQAHTHTQGQHTQIQCYVMDVHTSSLPPWCTPTHSIGNIQTHKLLQAPHLPQFAEQTVRRSTPLWGSFSGARDMKSQLNSYAVAC